MNCDHCLFRIYLPESIRDPREVYDRPNLIYLNSRKNCSDTNKKVFVTKQEKQ